MNRDKIDFLFPLLPAWADPDDRSIWKDLFSADSIVSSAAPSNRSVRLGVLEIIAMQVADDDPPEVFETVKRLSKSGLDRNSIIEELASVVASTILSTLDKSKGFDKEKYCEYLSKLPFPDSETILNRVFEIVQQNQPIPISDLVNLTSSSFNYNEDDSVFNDLFRDSIESNVGPDSDFRFIEGDKIVMPASFTEGVILTHRIAEFERKLIAITATVDLCVFARLEESFTTVNGDLIESFTMESLDNHVDWFVPEGWFNEYQNDALITVRPEGEKIRIELLDYEPTVEESVVNLIRSVYDRENSKTNLPVSPESLLLGVMLEDKDAFRIPTLPFSELITLAGLEIVGSWVVHSSNLMETLERHRTAERFSQFLDEDDVPTILWALDLFNGESTDLSVAAATNTTSILKDLSNPNLLTSFVTELFGIEEDFEKAEEVLYRTETFLAHANKETKPVLRYILAMAMERVGKVLEAEHQLRLAVGENTSWKPAKERLAWYLFDKGDAVEATRLWNSIGIDIEDSNELAVMEKFTHFDQVKLGRNEMCWCGSGIKFKKCHLGKPGDFSLLDRIGWFKQKSVSYICRSSALGVLELINFAYIRSEFDDIDLHIVVEEALSDSVLVDIILTEGGWFESFLKHRGPLLPADEALLGASWMLVDRTIYEIKEILPGISMKLCDLRTGDLIEVEETSTRFESAVGELILARAVPIGDVYKFIGFVMSVRPGTEMDLFEILDEGSPEDLVAYITDVESPPELLNFDSDPVVVCKCVFAVDDSEKVRVILRDLYDDQSDNEWVVTLGIDEKTKPIGKILLEGDRLTVEAFSEKRFENIVDTLKSKFIPLTIVSLYKESMDKLIHSNVHSRLSRPDSEALTDESKEFDLSSANPAIEQLLDRYERKWCDEPIPALKGLTPRQALGDPAMRETLDRLLKDFDRVKSRIAEDDNGFAMRPDRLRKLLDIYQE